MAAQSCRSRSLTERPLACYARPKTAIPLPTRIEPFWNYARLPGSFRHHFSRSKVIGNFLKAATVLPQQAVFADVPECRLAEFRQG